jgi:hypothetical protein
MALRRLIYKSTYETPFTNEFLRSIEEASKRNNAELDVTGMLISNRSSFLQVLEGEQKHVNAIYNKILHDPRHTDIELISYEQIEQREFPDWSMKCVSVGILGRIMAERLKKKFGEEEADLVLPTDGDKAFALLYDLAFLQKSGELFPEGS